MDMDTHPLSVDIGYLKEQGLMQPETAGVNGGQIGFILRGIDRADNAPHLIDAQDGREPLLPFGADKFKSVPVALKHIEEKELDALEEKLKKIQDINSVELLDIRRAIG